MYKHLILVILKNKPPQETNKAITQAGYISINYMTEMLHMLP